MTVRNFLVFLKDLFAVLPGRSLPEWTEMAALDTKKPTVILVSGFAATSRSLTVIRKRLLRDGFNVLILSLDWQSLSDGVRGLYRMAELLSSTVLQLRKQPGMTRHSKIYLVAHSAGGLVARHYIQLLGGFHYIEALITLATPHQGTWIAGLGLCTHLILKARCLIQMLPISPFIRSLNTAPFPKGFKLISMYSRGDLLCPPGATTLPEGWEESDPWIETVEMTDLSHSDFLLSKTSYRLLIQYLQNEQEGSTKSHPRKKSPPGHDR